MTGDRPMDDGGQALVKATREALLNAVRHGAAPVSVYVEVGPSGVEAFVRDHGPGFEMGESATTGSGCARASSAGCAATAAPPRSAGSSRVPRSS